MSRLVDIRLVRGRDGEWRAKSGDAQPQVFEAGGCGDCPLRTDAWECRAAAGRRLLEMFGAYDDAPRWCPLRQGPTVVVLAGE